MVRLGFSVVLARVLWLRRQSMRRQAGASHNTVVRRRVRRSSEQLLLDIEVLAGWRADEWVLHVGDGTFQRGIFAEKNGASGAQLMWQRLRPRAGCRKIMLCSE